MFEYYIEIGQDGDWYMFDEGFNTYEEALTRKHEAEKIHPEWINYGIELRVRKI